MTIGVIITICALLLIAYVFDITSSRTKIPSVILLLILGWGVRQITSALDMSIPNLSSILPVLGTLGLILIVLEGSMELELDRTKVKLIRNSFIMALLPMVVVSIGLGYAFTYFVNVSFKTGMANAIPLTVISCAIVIPSVKHFIRINKEFVTYESSFSDVLGIILFNFITFNTIINLRSVGYFFLNILITLIISLAGTVLLVYLLSKIKHHVKIVPIILLIVLIYSISIIFHLPGLILIIMSGLFLGNLNKIKELRIIHHQHPEALERDVRRFKEITNEATFLVRTSFFLLFGYLIETQELINMETMLWAILISGGIFIVRLIHLKIMKLQVQPLIYIAPRGLITIMLFLSLPKGQTIGLINNSLLSQVIVITTLVMMFGIMKTNNSEQ